MFPNHLTTFEQSEKLKPIQLVGSVQISELENKIADYYGMKHALCVSNATIGLLGLALASDLKNSEFITSPYTFGGTVSGLLLLNNSIVFADVESTTATINVNEIEKSISTKTKAILAVDILGNPCCSEGLRKIADDYGLWYFADSAQSFGAKRNGFPASYLADALVISFTFGKTLFAGEGGAIVTNNSELYEKLLWHTQHPFRQKRELGLGLYNEFGINGRIHPFAAILANENFEKSLEALENYQTQCLQILELLNESGLIEEVNFRKENIKPSFFRLTIIPKKKVKNQDIQEFLLRHNIYCKFSSVPVSVIYKNPSFLLQFENQFRKTICREAERQADQRISLVIHNSRGDDK